MGATYNVSFFLLDDSNLTTAQQLSTNGCVDTVAPLCNNGIGGNGADVLVFGGAIPTIGSAPEPATVGLLGVGLIVAGLARRKRKS